MLSQIKLLFRENKVAILFIAKLSAIFLLFYLLYEHVLSVYTNANTALIDIIMKHSEKLLVFLGYELLQPYAAYGHHIGIKGTSGVVIGDPCNGMSLFILYSSFILVFKGKFWFKLLAITLGIFSIYLMNVIRIVALAIIVKDSPESLQFHHSYTFTLLVYAFIFLLWMLRIKVYQMKRI